MIPRVLPSPITKSASTIPKKSRSKPSLIAPGHRCIHYAFRRTPDARPHLRSASLVTPPRTPRPSGPAELGQPTPSCELTAPHPDQPTPEPPKMHVHQSPRPPTEPGPPHRTRPPPTEPGLRQHPPPRAGHAGGSGGSSPRKSTASHRRRPPKKGPSIGRRRVATGANHPASRSSAFRRGPGTPAAALRRGTRAPI